jgi:hypothetical protein
MKSRLALLKRHDGSIQRFALVRAKFNVRCVSNYEHVHFNLNVLEGQTVAVLGWMNTNGPAERFSQSLSEVPDCLKAHAVMLALQYLENIYLYKRQTQCHTHRKEFWTP